VEAKRTVDDEWKARADDRNEKKRKQQARADSTHIGNFKADSTEDKKNCC
jgi:hypothetical protein